MAQTMPKVLGALARLYVLRDYADDLERQAREAPPGEARDGMAAEALAARARILELERGVA